MGRAVLGWAECSYLGRDTYAQAGGQKGFMARGCGCQSGRDRDADARRDGVADPGPNPWCLVALEVATPWERAGSRAWPALCPSLDVPWAAGPPLGLPVPALGPHGAGSGPCQGYLGLLGAQGQTVSCICGGSEALRGRSQAEGLPTGKGELAGERGRWSVP